MERAILGDNQFFGVNHSSDEKSRSQAIKFKDNSSIIKVLKFAQDEGINTFMCTTHDRMIDISKSIKASGQFESLSIYPCLPYAHKYANTLADLGILGSIKQYAPGNVFHSFAKGSVAFLKKDYLSIFELLIDAEMKMFKGIRTPVIFMQNVITDLLLGLGFNDLFIFFYEYISEHYKAVPGFITMNFPRLLTVLEEVGIKYPTICTSINKIGFRMGGGKESYERVIQEKRCNLIAMQVFASGSLLPSDAISYVCQFDGISSILFGASSRENISSSKHLIDQYTKSTQVNALAMK